MTLALAKYPFGAFAVDAAFRKQYDRLFPLATTIELPHELPRHHPALERLGGVYETSDAPAPWWPDCASAAPPPLTTLLAEVSPREYRQGTIAEQRWNDFARDAPQWKRVGPRIHALLEACQETRRWSSLFRERGSTHTPLEWDFTVSTRPDHFLHMSNGWGWTSCQSLTHSRKDDGLQLPCLPGNFYDTGVAVAMLRPRGEEVWSPHAVIARLTLRVLTAEKQLVIGIGQTYHNNFTAAYWLAERTISLLEAHGLAWGVIDGTRTHEWLVNGALGAGRQAAARYVEPAWSSPVWVPPDVYHPYVDGIASWVFPGVASSGKELAEVDLKESASLWEQGWSELSLNLITPFCL